MATYTGTNGNDTITDGSSNTLIYGLDGNDYIDGGAGNDTIYGNGDNDYINGGTGNDVLNGGNGDDTLTGGQFMFGGYGDDTYLFNLGDGISYIYELKNGTDASTDSKGYDKVIFGAGINPEDVTFTPGLSRGSADDIIIKIKDQPDELHINVQANPGAIVEEFHFQDGTIYTYSDVIAMFEKHLGTSGNDAMNPRTYIYAEEMYGLEGNDNLNGSSFDDYLDGGEGNDTIYGNNGDDTLTGGQFMFGGYGDDTYLFNLGDGISYVYEMQHGEDASTDQKGFDKVVFGAGINPEDVTFTPGLSRGEADDIIITIKDQPDELHINVQSHTSARVEEFHFQDGTIYTYSDVIAMFAPVQGSSGDDILNARTINYNETIYGNEGNDLIISSKGNDLLSGGSGNDTIIANLGADTIYGGEGDDSVRAEGTELADFAGSLIYGEAGNDTLHGEYSNDTIYGGIGNDSILGGGDNDHIEGGDGDDYLMGDFVGHTSGGNYSDTILGGAGNDTIYGENTLAGYDTISQTFSAAYDDLTGGTGNDVLFGGGGNDIYRFNFGDGQDTINDHHHVYDLYAQPTPYPDANGGSADKIIFGPNIALEDLSFRKDGNNLIINNINSTDSITVSNHFHSSNYYKIDNFELNDGTVIEEQNLYVGTLNDDTLTAANTNDYIFGSDGNDSITTLAGNDYIQGGAGNDTMLGGTGDDTYIVESAGDVVTELLDEGTDTVKSYVDYSLTDNVENLDLLGTSNIDGTGNDLNNSISGNTGRNILDGGFGADTLQGGANNDTYIVDNADDIVIENVYQGYDTVQSSVTYTLTDNVERLILTGTENINGTGNNLSNSITGNDGNNILDGQAGADTMTGDFGDDTYIVDNAGDIVTEFANEGVDTVKSSITYTLTDNLENLSLTGNTNIDGTGNSLDNTITGNSGNNILDGQAGADTMIGGIGDDTYVVDDADDIVTELANEGVDSVESSITYTLTDNVENLSLTGVDNIDGIGNDLDNTITGNGGSNRIDGRTGADTMIGGLGDDTYIVDNANDVISELTGEGTDTLQTSVSYNLNPTNEIENIVLTGTDNIDITGSDSDNNITGNSGNNRIDGGAGADTMAGGLGNDTYVVDNAGDILAELANEGIDSVESSISYSLTENVENLSLTGADSIDGTGNNLDNTITGNSGNNIIDGLEGNDTLNGSTGADTMIGGLGDDTYIVDNVDDVVIENINEGNDTVESSIDYTLVDNVENLTLTGFANNDGTGNDLDNIITGNSGNNVLNGALGNDTLNGGSGRDTLYGGEGIKNLNGGYGNDTYIITDADDIVTEHSSQGTDTVESDITYTLTNNVEILRLQGTSNLNGTGNSRNNNLYGNDGNNVLTGLAGRDNLNGGIGADTMIGGTGNDNYFVDNVGDVVTELNGEGTDRVYSSLDYTLTDEDNVENLTLQGAAIYGTGDNFNNDIDGNSVDNVLTGLAGNDTIDGKAGADTMIGGAGNDVIYVDNVNDVETELNGEGNDTIKSSISYTLTDTDNLENIHLIGSDDINAIGDNFSNELKGNSGNNLINGLLGNDSIYGGSGDDTINSGNGNNIVYGELGNDIINGGINEDTLYGGEGNDSIKGGISDDKLYGDSGNDYLDGGDGNDSLYGGDGNDTLDGDAAGDDAYMSNYLDGGAGNDYITSRKANIGTPNNYDTIIGGTGDDTIVADNLSRIYYNLGDGSDVILGENMSPKLYFGEGIAKSDISMKREGNDVVISIAGTSDTITMKDYCNQGLGLGEIIFDDGTLLTNREFIILHEGTPNPDVIDGTDSRDIIKGLESDDTLKGHSYHDTIYGEAGNDSLEGGSENDVLYGGEDNDYLNGGSESDTLYGGSGNDTLYADLIGEGDRYTTNYLDGGSGDDVLHSRKDNIGTPTYHDTLIGGTGNDTITADGWSYIYYNLGDGSDTIYGENMSPRLIFGEGINPSDISMERIGNDVIISIAGTSDTITMKDYMDGYWGIGELLFNDGTLITNRDFKIIHNGTSGDDAMTGLYSKDIIYGHEGNDSILGNQGADTLYGGDGNDTIHAFWEPPNASNQENSDEADVLIGGKGNDTMRGGKGNDTYIYNLGDGNDYIADYGYIQKNGYTTATNGGVDKIIFGEGISKSDITYRRFANHNSDNYELSLYINDSINYTDHGQIHIHKHFEPTNIFKIEQIEFANGEVVNTADIYTAFSLYSTDGADTLTGTSYSESIYGKGGNDSINGGAGNDYIDGGIGDDTIYAESGNDTLTGARILFGGSGDDTYLFNLGEGNGYIYEESGYDKVIFGEGINPEDVTFTPGLASGVSDDIIITFAGHTEKLSVNILSTSGTQVEEFHFQDGTIFTYNDVLSKLEHHGTSSDDTINPATSIFQERMFGLEGDDVINGTAFNDYIDGGTGNDTIYGNNGNDTLVGGNLAKGGAGDDTYIFNLGDGTSRIYEESGYDKVIFGEGINPEDLIFTPGLSSGQADDIIISFAGSTDELHLNILSASWAKIEEFHFQDGTIFTYNDVLSKLEHHGTSSNDNINPATSIFQERMFGHEGDDVINGTAFNDYIDGGEGKDTIYGNYGNDTLTGGYLAKGGHGNDTYLYNLTDGTTLIYDYISSSNVGGNDKVIFGDGLLYEDAIFSMSTWSTNNDVVIDFKNEINPIDRIIINNQNISNEKIETLQFADGATLSNSSFWHIAHNSHIGTDSDNLLSGTSSNNYMHALKGNDTLKGYAGNDLLDGGAGNDTLEGGDGNDRYYFARDWDNDTITDSSGIDNIKFGTDVTKNDLAIYLDNNNLIIANANNEIVVNNQTVATNAIEKVSLSTGEYLSDTDINQIIQDMTAYATDNGISMTSINDVKNNTDLMNIISNSWHN